MGYETYLKNLLSPLGVYDTENGYSAAELSALGTAMDNVSDMAQILERECTIMSAESYGILNYEKILPIKPVNRTTSMKRDALAALLRVDDASFTAKALNSILCGCGIPALVEETDTANTVMVSFPGTRGMPDDMDVIQKAVESILPCHLGITYYIVYITWKEAEGAFSTWAELETQEFSWKELERYGSL